MKPSFNHKWDLSDEKAEALQTELAGKISNEEPFRDLEEVKTLAALDVDYGKGDEPATAAAVVVRLPGLEVLERFSAAEEPSKLRPYVPGLLSFREIPPLLKVLKKVKNADVLLVNGQGRAHPRRFGLACHLGLLFDKPSVGCAETWLFGGYDEPPPGLAGAYTYLRNGDEPVGVALRSRAYSRPIFVSPGHRMGVVFASDLVMTCVREHRLPEPLRFADELARGKTPAKPVRRAPRG